MYRKKTFLITLLMVVSFMSSCTNQLNIAKPQGKYDIVTADEYNLNVKESKGAIIKDYIDDSGTAQLVGDAVIKSIVGDDKFKTLININISYDVANGIWLINRSLGADTIGGDYTCAIKKSNGEILKVWAGE